MIYKMKTGTNAYCFIFLTAKLPPYVLKSSQFTLVHPYLTYVELLEEKPSAY